MEDVTVVGDHVAGERRRWLRWLVVLLAVCAALVLTSGLYLTFAYRPADHVAATGAEPRSSLVGPAQWTHRVAAYGFVLAALATTGVAMRRASRQRRAIGLIAASGLSLAAVGVAFLVTGRQLPWRALTYVAGSAPERFSGMFFLPEHTTAVLVGHSELSSTAFQVWAAVHILVLPVFAVFAALWFGGAVPTAPPLAAEVIPVPDGGEEPPPASIEELVFGTDDPHAIVTIVSAFLEARLRATVVRIEFITTGAAVVVGAELSDGRRVVVKARPPTVNARYLDSTFEIRHDMVALGFPAPAPLVAPASLGRGIATVEELLDRGEPDDARRDAVRRASAHALAWLVHHAAPYADRPGLVGRGILGPRAAGSAFPAPPDPTYDFAATAEDAEWIDALAQKALDTIRVTTGLPTVVGPTQWRGDHLRFTVRIDHPDGPPQAEVSAVYGWDHLAAEPEAVVVGRAAHAFTTDWRSAHLHVPTLAEARAFIADYERARGAPFDERERTVVRAAYVYATAYSARCEHALAVTGRVAANGFRDRLAAHGPNLLPRT